MKTPSEMLQFSGKYQHAQKKQHALAFRQIYQKFAAGEYAIFTFVGESCSRNDSPGPWHISVAITNKHLFLSGETLHGQLMPLYATYIYDRKQITAVQLQGRQLVLHCGNDIIKIQGENLGTIVSKLKNLL